MRAAVARLLSWIAGTLVGIAVVILLLLVVPSSEKLLSAVNAALILVAWLAARRKLAQHPVARSIAASATLVCVVLLLDDAVVVGFASTKAHAYVTTMKSDLRNLVTAEEEFFRDSARYTADTVSLVFRSSTGTKGVKIALTSDGWTASAGHQAIDVTCSIFVGRTPLPPATVEGTAACTPRGYNPRPLYFALACLGASIPFAGLATLVSKRAPAI